MKKFFFASHTLLMLFGWLCCPSAMEDIPAGIREVGITEHLGESLPLDLVFMDSSGSPYSLKTAFKQGKPVILLMVYFDCPMLCNLVLDGFIQGIIELKDLSIGKDYQVVTVSFDPRDTPEKALKFQERYIRKYQRPVASEDWKFLTGDALSIEKLSTRLGFNYKYNEKSGEFAHNAAIFVASDDGVLSRYLYGIEYRPLDLKLALTEASEHKWYPSAHQLLLYCFSYDPQSRQYVIHPRTVMKLGGALFLVILAVGACVYNKKKTPGDLPDQIHRPEP